MLTGKYWYEIKIMPSFIPNQMKNSHHQETCLVNFFSQQNKQDEIE